MAIADSLTRGLFIAKNVYNDLKPFREALGTAGDLSSRVSNLTSDAINKPGSFASNNDSVNKIKAIANVWNNQLIKLLIRDENYWMEWSSVNLFDPKTIEPALTNLQGLRNKLSGVCSSFSALIPIIYGLGAIQGLSDKGIYAFSPSLAGLEYMAINDTLTEVKAVYANANSIVRKLDNCIQTLERK